MRSEHTLPPVSPVEFPEETAGEVEFALEVPLTETPPAPSSSSLPSFPLPLPLSC